MTYPPWKPSKAVAYLLAVLTVWPVLYIGLFMSFVFFTFAAASAKHGPPLQFDLFKFIFPLHCGTMVITFGLTAAYIVHAFRNDRLESDKRILWVIVLFMGNLMAFPVYWWFYVRPSSPHVMQAESESAS